MICLIWWKIYIDTDNPSKRKCLSRRSYGLSTELTSEGISSGIPEMYMWVSTSWWDKICGGIPPDRVSNKRSLSENYVRGNIVQCNHCSKISVMRPVNLEQWHEYRAWHCKKCPQNSFRTIRPFRTNILHEVSTNGHASQPRWKPTRLNYYYHRAAGPS